MCFSKETHLFNEESELVALSPTAVKTKCKQIVGLGFGSIYFL